MAADLDGGELHHTADGASIYVKTWATAEAPKAVLLAFHGLGEHCNRYKHVFSVFSEAGVRVTAFDLRGHGRSSGTRGDAGDESVILADSKFVYDIARKGFESVPIFFFGHSLGGLNALVVSIRSGLDFTGLIASAPAVGVGFEPNAVKVAVGKLLAVVPFINRVTVANDLDLEFLSRDPQVAVDYKKDPLVHGYISLRSANYVLTTGKTLVGDEFTKPMLMAHGTVDTLTSSAASKEFFGKVAAADKEYKSYEDYRHELHNEIGKEEVIGGYRDWILARI